MKNKIIVNFIYPNGEKTKLTIPEGENVLKYAIDNNIMIVAKCGGVCSCSTCAIYISKDEFLINESIQEISDEELDIIESQSSINQFNTRLCCQLIARKDIDNITLYIYETSYGKDE